MANKKDILIFLNYWDNPKPTSDDQLGFMLAEMDNESEAEEIGEVYNNNFLYGKNKEEAIKTEIRKHKPTWVIGLENSATIILHLHRQKKILINPKVTTNDLNWVTEQDINDTYAFFSSDYESDYETYSKVYRNVAFFPMMKTLFISDIKAHIKAIIH